MNLPINTVLQGDSKHVLKKFPDCTFDSVVTDPPYGLSKEPDITAVLTAWLNGDDYHHGHKGFMNQEWDSFVPSPDLWREVFRVLKPGGHALVFAGTRTQDLMTISLRIAGFEVRDVVEWLYLSGFPKSQNVGKQFDKRAGLEREVTGYRPAEGGNNYDAWRTGEDRSDRPQLHKARQIPITAPAGELAKKWDGWGTALKPAHEPIILVRKPLIGTVCDNVENYRTGAIHIDACRIQHPDEASFKAYQAKCQSVIGLDSNQNGNAYGEWSGTRGDSTNLSGRFPSNCVTLDGEEWYSKFFNISPHNVSKKASKKDRNSNAAGDVVAENTHPTPKPIALMEWLIKLVTPDNGIVLDPFAGSGSTLVAAKRLGLSFLGIELGDIDTANKRIG